MSEYVQEFEGLELVLDPYNGITISTSSILGDEKSFDMKLEKLEAFLKQQNRRLIWITIDIKNSFLIPIAVKHGFFFHTCEKDYVFMVKRLVENAVIPTAANHTLGVGVVVFDDKGKVLVVKERISKAGYKFPGGHVDNAELIQQASKREVFEESGIEIEFDSIITIGDFYPHQFDQSNLYILCKAKAKTTKIHITDTYEIEDAKWVCIDEYLNDENVLEFNKEVLKAALNTKSMKSFQLDSLINIKRSYELYKID